MEATYERQAGVVPFPGPIPAQAVAATRVKLDADDDSWGWNLGALFTLSPATKVGVSYRSRVKYDLQGRIDVTGPVAPLNAAATSDAKASIKLPDFFLLSATHSLSDRVELLGDIAWTGWSSISRLDIVRTSGAGSGTTAQSLDTDFRDTWRVAVGTNYRYDAAWKLKFGIAYDQTPVRNAATRLTSLPDNNRTWFSTGAQWKPNKDSSLDFGLAYLYIKDAPIDNNQAAQGRGRVTGHYEDSAWILGAQYSVAF
jgi:long-chain fatty acid transport protein